MTDSDTRLPLHALLLEDAPDDALLMERALETAGYAVRAEIVDTEDEFVACLHPEVDVILADHALPQFNALRALDLVQRRGLDIPFIIVSGVIEEETAVEAMRRGAADYLLKDRLARLGPAVRQALRQKQHRVEKERAVEAIRRSEARYRLLAEHTTDVICRIGPDGAIWYISPSCKTLLGYEPEELIGRGAFDFVHPDDVDELRHGFSGVLDQPFRARITYRSRRKDGAYVWIEASSKLIRKDDSDGFREIVTVLRDVSEQRQAHEALEASEARWRKLVEYHPDPTLISRDGRIVYINPAGVRFLGAETEADVLGAPLARFVVPESRATLEEQLRAATAGRRTPPMEYHVHGPDGEGRIVEAFSVPVRYRGEACVQSVVRDVTARHTYEAQLIEAKERAEEMARLKSSLLANMSHEIRTPLTGIIGFSDVLAEDASGDVQRIAQAIRTGGERLLAMLDSVMELAQLEGGTMTLQPTALDLVAEIEALLPPFERQARAKGLYLRFEPDAPRVPGTMDRRALSRVLTNLLTNAVKYTERGGVTVTLGRAGTQVQLQVADTGIGIGRDFMEQLFHGFQQESEGLARTYEGVGLGLTITKGLVDMMGGTVEVESEKDLGAAFTVRLPAGAEVPASPSASAM